MTPNMKRDAILSAAEDDLGIHFAARQFANGVKARSSVIRFSTSDALEVLGSLGMWLIKTGKAANNEPK